MITTYKTNLKTFKWLEAIGYKHHYEGTVKELDKMKDDNPNLHAEIMHVILWIEKNHNIWITVRYHFDYKSFQLYIANTTNNMLDTSIYPKNIEKDPIKIYKLGINIALECCIEEAILYKYNGKIPI
jgi:hypothetical protein